MATPYAVPIAADIGGARDPPRLSVLRAVAVAGLATAAGSIALGLTNDGVSGVQVALLEWISLPYIVAAASLCSRACPARSFSNSSARWP